MLGSAKCVKHGKSWYTFDNTDHLIDRNMLQRIDSTTEPLDFDAVDFLVFPQSEVESSTSIAPGVSAPAMHFIHLGELACHNSDMTADRVAIGARTSQAVLHAVPHRSARFGKSPKNMYTHHKLGP